MPNFEDKDTESCSWNVQESDGVDVSSGTGMYSQTKSAEIVQRLSWYARIFRIWIIACHVIGGCFTGFFIGLGWGTLATGEPDGAALMFALCRAAIGGVLGFFIGQFIAGFVVLLLDWAGQMLGALDRLTVGTLAASDSLLLLSADPQGLLSHQQDINRQGKDAFAAGRYGEAAVRFREALKLDPDNANVWFNLGLALDESGETGEAEIAYRRALQLLPDLVPALTRLARLYTATGRATDAKPLWQRIVLRAPSSEAEREAQAALNASP